ncbi:hemerythrin domain-containing protein [Paenibacillus albidus]|uniref:hemerythrin domain-containing protein n=1 Tax=Paenibacillus albidus TaxID=2041023 RepID=UPI001BED05BB|nr:hemerythrin domain-containing protein [Paenibacillus albidus]MBT2289341.1 hemerythrin domain-containing protein [Paenibacillus albidus]
MAGPSLRQLHAHHAIHEGGLSGAVTKTEEMEELLEMKEFEVARQAADHLIDYWETRILSHADAEEDGFYQEMVEGNPDLAGAVAKLTRDHDILRTIVADIKVMIKENGLSPEVLQQFHALLVVNVIHSRDEERLLFEQPAQNR